MWTGNMYFDRVIKSDHVNGHLKKKASLPLVSFNRCKSKVHSVDILEGLSLALFTVQWGEILFWSVSKVRSRYDPFAYFSNSFISGESMVITIELNLFFWRGIFQFGEIICLSKLQCFFWYKVKKPRMFTKC